MRPTLRHFAGEAWLGTLFWFSSYWPSLPRLLRPLILSIAWASSPVLRRGTLANAGRLLGETSTARERRALARRVIGSFFDRVVEFGLNRRRTPEELLAGVESVTGEAHYDAARRRGRGAILATAHLGSFETAIALVARREGGGQRVHVVFRRDRSGLFERLRAEQRRRLGVVEAPVDEGLDTWLGLREALRRDEVVLMQADRLAPGQKGVEAPFLGGHIRVPTGPVRLARLTGAPLIPVFALASGRGRYRLQVEEAIWTDGVPDTGSIDPALLRLVGAVERVVRAHPDQWLCLHPAWCEDQDAARSFPAHPARPE